VISWCSECRVWNRQIISLRIIVVTLSMSSGISTSPLRRFVANLVSERNPNFSHSNDIVIDTLIDRLNLCSITCWISAFISLVSTMSTTSVPFIHCTSGMAPNLGLLVTLFICFHIDFCSLHSILLNMPLYLSLSPPSWACIRQLRTWTFLRPWVWV
jgi:hypothetical protein